MPLIDSVRFLNPTALWAAAVIAVLSGLTLWRAWFGPRAPYASALCFGVSLAYLGSCGLTVTMAVIMGADLRAI